MAYMGCVQGTETVTYTVDGKEYAGEIGKAFDKLSTLGINIYGVSEYIDLTNHDVKIYDTYSAKFVKVKKWIKNPNKNNWKHIVFESGHTLNATEDHPLPIVNRGRTFVRDIEVGDAGYIVCNDGYTESKIISIEDIEINEPSFDVETESDRFDVSGIMSHNCRTRVIGNVYDPSYEKVTGRGNLSFTSINLPRLGIKARGNIDRFFEMLDDMMQLVHDQLISRFEVQCRKHPRNYPFLMGQGVWKDSDKLGPDDDITEILKHGTLTVGFIGLAECLVALTGKHHGECKESQELGLRIVKHMRETADKWAKEERLNYSVIATPQWGTHSYMTA